MEIVNVQDLLANARKRGHIFSVQFIKRTDNTYRDMVCRTGVKIGLTGQGHAFDPDKKKLLCVWDIQKHAYRFVSLDSIVKLKVGGRRYSAVSGGMVADDQLAV